MASTAPAHFFAKFAHFGEFAEPLAHAAWQAILARDSDLQMTEIPTLESPTFTKKRQRDEPADTGVTEPADTGVTEPADTGVTEPADTGVTEPPMLEGDVVKKRKTEAVTEPVDTGVTESAEPVKKSKTVFGEHLFADLALLALQGLEVARQPLVTRNSYSDDVNIAASNFVMSVWFALLAYQNKLRKNHVTAADLWATGKVYKSDDVIKASHADMFVRAVKDLTEIASIEGESDPYDFFSVRAVCTLATLEKEQVKAPAALAKFLNRAIYHAFHVSYPDWASKEEFDYPELFSDKYHLELAGEKMLDLLEERLNGTSLYDADLADLLEKYILEQLEESLEPEDYPGLAEFLPEESAVFEQ